MTPDIEQHATLHCHPSTATGRVHGFAARVRVMRTGALAILYHLYAQTSRLRIASPRVPRRSDGLWQHTCFEAFIAVNDGPAYYEFNFSPSGEWAVYGFGEYRAGGSIEGKELAPQIDFRSDKDGIELTAAVSLDKLPLIRQQKIIRVGLSAVIEASDGTLSYWALKHPSDEPDFHHPDSFTLELALPEESA